METYESLGCSCSDLHTGYVCPWHTIPKRALLVEAKLRQYFDVVSFTITQATEEVPYLINGILPIAFSINDKGNYHNFIWIEPVEQTQSLLYLSQPYSYKGRLLKVFPENTRLITCFPEVTKKSSVKKLHGVPRSSFNILNKFNYVYNVIPTDKARIELLHIKRRDSNSLSINYVKRIALSKLLESEIIK